MHFGVVAIVVGLMIVFFGALVQGSIGFGINLLSAPVIALVAPKVLPTAIVIVALPTALSIFAREHHAVDWRLLRWMLVGSIPGTLVGLALLGAVDHQELTIVIGVITLIGVGLSVLKVRVRVAPDTAVTASVVSNIFGTASGVGGPPMALLFQHHAGPVARATLSAFFVVSTVTSLIGYIATGEFHGYQALYGLILLPAMAAGVWTSKHLHGHVDGGWLRPAVLVVSAIAGMAALINGLI